MKGDPAKADGAFDLQPIGGLLRKRSGYPRAGTCTVRAMG